MFKGIANAIIHFWRIWTIALMVVVLFSAVNYVDIQHEIVENMQKKIDSHLEGRK